MVVHGILAWPYMAVRGRLPVVRAKTTLVVVRGSMQFYVVVRGIFFASRAANPNHCGHGSTMWSGTVNSKIVK